MYVIKRPKKRSKSLAAISIVLLSVPLLMIAIIGMAVLKQYPGVLNVRFSFKSVEVNLDGRQVPSNQQLPGK